VKLICEFQGEEEDLLEGKDNSGATPIFAAVRYNELPCLKVLLHYGANVFAKKRNGDTALHEAAAFNALECMGHLATFGGIELVKKRNRQGQRAINVAEVMRNYECF